MLHRLPVQHVVTVPVSDTTLREGKALRHKRWSMLWHWHERMQSCPTWGRWNTNSGLLPSHKLVLSQTSHLYEYNNYDKLFDKNVLLDPQSDKDYKHYCYDVSYSQYDDDPETLIMDAVWNKRACCSVFKNGTVQSDFSPLSCIGCDGPDILARWCFLCKAWSS